MVYLFEYGSKSSNQQKIKNLKKDILIFKQACLSKSARPIDYTNLIDAQQALKDLKA